MSLYKQFWLAIVLLLTLVYGVSIVVSAQSTRSYLQAQLAMKNADNAAALALSLTQQGADAVLLELTISAQFDTGFYELIELVDPQGKVTIRREANEERTSAPMWFMELFPIEVEPGVASIQAGWHSVGTLTLRSHSHFAYEELWANVLELAAVFLLAALGAGLVGGLLLRRILRPLADVVAQAEAIGNQQYVTIAEPATPEFRQVVRALNDLSAKVQTQRGSDNTEPK